MIVALSLPALGQTPPPPPDVSVSSVGVQTWSDSALRGGEDVLRQFTSPTDMDVVLGERLRWTVAGDLDEPGSDLVMLADARFTLDPGPEGSPMVEWSQVRQLGVQYLSDRWTVDLGRSLVYRGGPRLVDGVQALYAASPKVKVGAWAGLAPDLFTTRPELRPGGGPVFSFASSNAQLSIVGEALTYEGAVDRIGVLTMGRYSFERVLDLSGRLDLELMGDLGPRPVDLLLQAGANPNKAIDLDLMYNAFSTYRYLETELLDPDVQRFAERLEQLGLLQDIVQDTRDPTLNHLVGGGVRWQPDTDAAAPRIGILSRYRHHPDEVDRYLRINPYAGVVRVGDVVDVTVDANYWQVGNDEAVVNPDLDPTVAQVDGGVVVYVEPDGTVAFDGSFRVVSAPEDIPKPTYYADLFVNVVSPPLDLLFIAGGMVASEQDVIDGQDSTGFGVFVRMAKYVRPARR